MHHDRTASYHQEQQLEEVLAGYLEAVRTGHAPERGELLARHPDLVAELQDFFADHDLVRDLAEPLRCDAAVARTPPAVGDTVAIPAESLPHRFGDYELLAEIARGGMGIVYRARQVSLNRVVALKMIEPGGRAPEEIEHFLHSEAQAVANLDHPHIVPIYEAGVCEGRPFFSMKLIEGGNLSQRLRDTAPLPQRDVAQLTAAVARAVHHAHQRGILHRDLKPSNVLLDQAGQPHVTDFGLARRVEGDSIQSQSGAISGTPPYMSPEQACGEKRQTTAVDVYSMGAVLYELLTGRPPFRAATPLETLLQVQTQEPPRLRALDARIDRDLETICLKCLDKDPGRRYGSAEAVADDLEHWLNGEPIRARRAGSWERALLWTRRRPAAAAVAGSILCLCLCLFGFALWGWQNAMRAEQAADGRATAEEKARQNADSRAGAEQKARDAAEKEAKALQKARLMEAARADAEARKTRLVEAHLALERANNHFLRDEVAQGLLWLARGLEVVPEDETELRLSFRRLLAGWSPQVHPLQQILPIADAANMEVAVSPDGKLLAAAWNMGRDKPPRVQLSDMVTGKPVGKPIPHQGTPLHAKFSPDSMLLAIACHDEPTKICTVRFWDVATQQPVGAPMVLRKPAVAHRMVEQIAFSPDGKRLVTVDDPISQDFGVQLWDVPTGKPVADPLPARETRTAVFSPDGKMLLTGGGSEWDEPYEIRLWDAETGKPRGEPVKQSYAVTSAAFSSDGKRFVTAGFRPSNEKARNNTVGFVQVFATATGMPISDCEELPRGSYRVALGPDGKTILVRSYDWNFQLFRIGQGRQLKSVGRPISGLQGMARGYAFSPDGKAVLLINDRHQARLWDTITGEPIGAATQTRGGVGWVGFANNGRTMLTWNGADMRRWAIAWPTAGQKLDFPDQGLFFSAAFSPDGRTVAVACLGAKWGVWLWDRTTGKPAGLPIVSGGRAHYVAYSPDGKILLTAPGDVENSFDLWDAATRTRIGVSIPVGGDFWRRQWAKVAISSDSKWVVAADGKVAQLYEACTGKPTGKRFEHDDVIWEVALSPDGKRVLTGGADKVARLWDAETGRPVGKALKHPATVDFVAFSPDGKQVLTSAPTTAQLWDAQTGQPIGQPIPHATPSFLPLRFSRDGKSVLTVGWEPGTARLWDTATGKPRGPYLRHPVRDLTFSPDGKMVVTAGAGGMQVWDAATGRPVGNPLWKTRSGSSSVNEVESVVFSPDSRTLLAWTTVAPLTSEARLFELTQPVAGDPARLRLWVEVMTARELDAGGEVVELDAKTWQERSQQLQALGGPP
jgi:WD40 repeat protein